MLSSMFLVGGASALKHTDRLAQRAKPVVDRFLPAVERTMTVPFTVDAKRLVQLNAGVHIVAGSMLATGRAPRTSALVLATSLVPTTVAGHRFWEESDPLQRSNQRVHFTKNLSLMGGLLIAAVDTEGRPSLAWWARRRARQLNKATQLTKTTQGTASRRRRRKAKAKNPSSS